MVRWFGIVFYNQYNMHLLASNMTFYLFLVLGDQTHQRNNSSKDERERASKALSLYGISSDHDHRMLSLSYEP